MRIPSRRRRVYLSGNAADLVVPGGRSASGKCIRGRFPLIGRPLATDISHTDECAFLTTHFALGRELRHAVEVALSDAVIDLGKIDPFPVLTDRGMQTEKITPRTDIKEASDQPFAQP
jgi:hypothetical protein